MEQTITFLLSIVKYTMLLIATGFLILIIASLCSSISKNTKNLLDNKYIILILSILILIILILLLIILTINL